MIAMIPPEQFADLHGHDLHAAAALVRRAVDPLAVSSRRRVPIAISARAVVGERAWRALAALVLAATRLSHSTRTTLSPNPNGGWD